MKPVRFKKSLYESRMTKNVISFVYLIKKLFTSVTVIKKSRKTFKKSLES